MFRSIKNKNRMLLKNLMIFLFITVVITLNAQKIPLSHDVYDTWYSISNRTVSEDGKWITWEKNPQQGDSWLYVYNTDKRETDSVFCGYRASFSPGCKYLVYMIKPTYSETRQAKVKKLKQDQMPKSNMVIRVLDTGKRYNFEKVKSYSLPESGSLWMAFLFEKKNENKSPEKSNNENQGEKQKQASSGKQAEAKGTELVILNPVTGKEFRYNDVTEYVVARDGRSISFLQDIQDTTKIDTYKVFQFNTEKETLALLFEGKGSLEKLSCDKSGELLAFMYTSDTSKIKVFDLFLSKSGNSAVKIPVQGLPDGWVLSRDTTVSFSEDRTRLFFGTAPAPVKEPEDTLLDEEKYKLDIWSWNDDVLQPMQKKQLNREKKRVWLAVYHIDRNRMIQLATKDMPDIVLLQKGNNDIALGSSNIKYRKLISWDANNYADYFIVNVETGQKSLILEKAPSRVIISPSGKYVLYWNIDEKQWISYSVASGTKKAITTDIPYPLYDEISDIPSPPSPYGIAGWMDDERYVLVYDRYDIWKADLTGTEKPVCLTNSFGRSKNLTFRYVRLDRDAEFINRKELLYLSAFDNTTKESGFFTAKYPGPGEPVKLVMGKCSFQGGLTKAKKADILLWQKGSFEEYPELYFSDMKFSEPVKISITNPQQSKYIWGSVELVSWKSFDGKELQGLLYKPENFNPAGKYPMIVYFYERSSDGMYSYIAPAPSASTINRTFAVSNGYLVFVPDIVYNIGYPGQSCYDAVVSGVQSLVERYSFIDREHIGLDGQSWGGYQVAYLVTRTNMFACAFAGAPVVNMISAYGGIRWATGMSRMFQYEMTQSRIGGTLWEKPLHFIENSPVFRIPEINTPLLIMHNDNDGAVPWYQGIEFITALRRLGKPAWMLSYNDEEHNLGKRPNRKDLSIRKMQFFDHYLKGAPMPYWMKNGISQLEKGKKDGYELIYN